MKAPLVSILAVAAAFAPTSMASAANCDNTNITAMSVSFAPAVPAYTTASGATTTATVSVTTNSNCNQLAIGFTAASGTLTGPSSNTLAFSITGAPSTAAPVDTTSVNNTTANLSTTYSIVFSAGQSKPAGSYVAGASPIEVVLYNRAGGGTLTEIRRATFNLQASITGSCSLSTGTAASASVSFTGHITNGVPTPTVKQHSLNVDCTVPAKVRLSGSAMTTATPANAAFDNFINYRAVATFSGATTTLTTNGTATVTSTSTGFSSTTGLNLPVTIDINMLAGAKPLLAGSYSNVMTVTVDPNL